jgi:hypothetical protein
VKKLLTLLITCFLLSNLVAQSEAVPDTAYEYKGFDFFISGGVYFGNAYTAAYYNGNPKNECNLNYIFNNKTWYDQITLQIMEKYPYFSDSIYYDEFPQEMSYEPALSIQLGFRYKFNKNWGFSFIYSFARLKATDVFLIKYKDPVPGNQRPDYAIENLFAQENRSFFDLSVTYIFHPHRIVKPFIELGAQFTYLKVKDFAAIIENQQYTLLDKYNGATYVPGQQLQEYNTVYGGAGYGISFQAGIRFAFSKKVAIEPAFYMSASSFGLKGYKDLSMQYGVYIRLIINDLIFSK